MKQEVTGKMKPVQILYVCVHNAGRSQMAEAFTNFHSKRLGLPVLARSAGTMGGKEINPMATQAMEEAGIPLDGHSPKILTAEMAESADSIISMGCGVDAENCPVKFLMTDDWNLSDPAGKSLPEVRAIRDEIEVRVLGLLSNLGSTL